MALKEFFKKVLYDLEKNSAGTPYVMSRLKTSELIRDNDRLSLSRFGDGEFGMVIDCGDLGFQPYSQSLHDALTEVLKNGVKTANLSVCIPGVFRSVDEMKPNAASFWMNWCLHSKKKLAPYFDPGYEYGDTNVSRLYLPWKDVSYERQIIDNIKSAWFGKTVVIAEGRQTRFGVGNDLLGGAKSISRILCPEKTHGKNTVKYCGSVKNIRPTVRLFLFLLSALPPRCFHMSLQKRVTVRLISVIWICNMNTCFAMRIKSVLFPENTIMRLPTEIKSPIAGTKNI